MPADSCKGLDISTYSYTDGTSVYLEEDCDVREWVTFHGIDREVIRHYPATSYNGLCFVRRLTPYRA